MRTKIKEIEDEEIELEARKAVSVSH